MNLIPRGTSECGQEPSPLPFLLWDRVNTGAYDTNFPSSVRAVLPCSARGLEQQVCDRDPALYSITPMTFGRWWAHFHRLWIVDFKAPFDVISPNLFIFPPTHTKKHWETVVLLIALNLNLTWTFTSYMVLNNLSYCLWDIVSSLEKWG